MPYRKGKFRHRRYIDPRNIEKGTFKTVPISHTKSRLKDEFPNAKAVVGISKKTGNRIIQKIMIPKNDTQNILLVSESYDKDTKDIVNGLLEEGYNVTLHEHSDKGLVERKFTQKPKKKKRGKK